LTLDPEETQGTVSSITFGCYSLPLPKSNLVLASSSSALPIPSSHTRSSMGLSSPSARSLRAANCDSSRRASDAGVCTPRAWTPGRRAGHKPDARPEGWFGHQCARFRARARPARRAARL